MGTQLSPFLTRENSCDIFFSFQHTKSLLKGIYSKVKEFAPRGSKFLPFRVDPCSEGRQNTFDRIALPPTPWICINSSLNKYVLLLYVLVGEPLNHEAWEWYYNVVGERRCDICDTWWQTGRNLLDNMPAEGIRISLFYKRVINRQCQANSIPDQMPDSVVSIQGLHCFVTRPVFRHIYR